MTYKPAQVIGPRTRHSASLELLFGNPHHATTHPVAGRASGAYMMWLDGIYSIPDCDTRGHAVDQ